MRITLIQAAFVFAAGTAIGLQLSGAAMDRPSWIAAGALAIVSRIGRHRRWGRYVLLAAVLAIGVSLSQKQETFPMWLRLRAGAMEEVTGTVISYPSVGTGHITFDLAPDTLPAGLRVTWFRASDAGLSVHYGDRFTLAGSVRLPDSFDGFDYAAYLARRGTFATMMVEGDGGRRQEGAGGIPILRAGDRLRQGLLARIRATLGSEAAGLAQGLLLGDRAALPDDVEEAFRKTGLMHVLAVSGLHLGIVLAGVWFVLRRVGLRPRIAYPVVGVVVLFVLWIVGPRVSLIRASLLFAFLAIGSVLADFGLILRRTVDPLNGLAAAAVVLLAIDPGQLLDTGFQLSFAATAGILVAISPAMRRRWEPRIERAASLPGRLRGPLQSVLVSVAISTAAQAAVAPVVAWHFGTFHPFLILFNVVIVPLVTVSLACGVPGILLLVLGAPDAVLRPFGWLLQALSETVRLLSRVPIVELPLPRLSAVWMAAIVAFTATAWYYSEVSS